MAQHDVFGLLGSDVHLQAELEAALVALEDGPLEAAARLAAPRGAA
jgi:hypothetical protein